MRLRRVFKVDEWIGLALVVARGPACAPEAHPFVEADSLMILFVDVPRHDPLAHDRVAWVPSKAAARADVEQVRRVS